MTPPPLVSRSWSRLPVRTVVAAGRLSSKIALKLLEAVRRT